MKVVAAALLLLAFATDAHAIAPDEHRLSTGMGLAVPDVTNLMNISTGDTPENPAGLMYRDGFSASLQVARYSGKNDTGFEGGYSGKNFGGALGFYSPGCDGCLKVTSGALGFAVSKDFLIGARYATTDQTPQYGAGLLVNAAGKHRVGATVNLVKPATPNNDTLQYGVGYGYVTKETTLSLEVSGHKADASDDAYNKIMQIALGFQKRVDVLQLGVTYKRSLNSTADPVPEVIWLGGGFNGQNWHLGLYSNMNQQFMVTISGLF